MTKEFWRSQWQAIKDAVFPQEDWPIILLRQMAVFDAGLRNQIKRFIVEDYENAYLSRYDDEYQFETIFEKIDKLLEV